jgi:hypothetical protein
MEEPTMAHTLSLPEATDVFRALSQAGLDAETARQIIYDPELARRIVLASTGSCDNINFDFDAWLAREVRATDEFCELAGVDCPSEETIHHAAIRAEDRFGALSWDDFFAPAGTDLARNFQFLSRFNKLQKEKGYQAFKIKKKQANREWIFEASDVQLLPMRHSIVHCNLDKAMRPITTEGKPFNLDYVAQQSFVQVHRAEDLPTAEAAFYLYNRYFQKTGNSLWAVGSARCSNNSGTLSSLLVDWDAREGFNISSWAKADASPEIGTLIVRVCEL